MKHIQLMAVLIAAVLSPLQAWAVAGRFQFVAGDVKVTTQQGKEWAARKGDVVNEGDTIASAPNASAQLKMADDGLIIVRSDTQMRISTFQFNGKADGSERSLISLVKGGFRAITGLIGRVNKDNYKIMTPTATIGIRGTDHEPMFIPNPAAGKAAIAEPGTYDKVNVGAAVISTPKGMVIINPNQAGFVPNVANATPVMLQNIPNFYRALPTKDEPQIQPQAAGATSAPAAKTAVVGGATLVAPSLSTTKLAPAATTLSPTTTLIAPTTTTLSPSTTLIAPTTTLQAAPLTTISPTISPTISTTTLSPTLLSAPLTTINPTIAPTTTLIAPTTTTIAPTTTYTAPTTTISPTTTLVAPTTIAPTTTYVAPTTTLVAPTTTITPTTTIVPTTTLIAPTTTLIAPTLSDRRLKMNIKRVGTHRLGFGIYEFDYIWGVHATGVMADEVKKVLPDAVISGPNGYDMVDYGKLN